MGSISPKLPIILICRQTILLKLYYCRILLEFGAGINTHSNEFKESALTLACYKGHLEMVRFLLEAGADQEHKTDEMHTALMEASMDGHVEVARLLLDSGAQVSGHIIFFLQRWRFLNHGKCPKINTVCFWSLTCYTLNPSLVTRGLQDLYHFLLAIISLNDFNLICSSVPNLHLFRDYIWRTYI